MSGNGEPNGPSAPASLNTEHIAHSLDRQTYVVDDTYTDMWPDPLPARIMRMERAKNAGTIGENSLDGAWPNWDRTYIPHQYTPRHPVGVTPYDKTIDTTVTIPAIFVGDPLH